MSSSKGWFMTGCRMSSCGLLPLAACQRLSKVKMGAEQLPASHSALSYLRLVRQYGRGVVSGTAASMEKGVTRNTRPAGGAAVRDAWQQQSGCWIKAQGW